MGICVVISEIGRDGTGADGVVVTVRVDDARNDGACVRIVASNVGVVVIPYCKVSLWAES